MFIVFFHFKKFIIKNVIISWIDVIALYLAGMTSRTSLFSSLFSRNCFMSFNISMRRCPTSLASLPSLPHINKHWLCSHHVPLPHALYQLQKFQVMLKSPLWLINVMTKNSSFKIQFINITKRCCCCHFFFLWFTGS